jgi:glycosyltransferase involved in cell wall biosynthesis
MRADHFSVVTPNRNRLGTLIEVLPSWQRCEQVAEIVVVDLGSRVPIRFDDFQSASKIKLVRVLNSDCWRIGLAINLGVDQASFDGICKLDSDIELLDGAALASMALDAAFYRGRAGSAVSNGQAVFSKRLWSKVGGYNEWLSGYGFDDSDFYARLRHSGVRERYIGADCLRELQHANESRAATESRMEFFNVDLPSADLRLLHMLSRNTYLGMLRRWSAELRHCYIQRQVADGTIEVELSERSDEYRWADALANMLAVVRLSGTPQNVGLLNNLVAHYLGAIGGL